MDDEEQNDLLKNATNTTVDPISNGDIKGLSDVTVLDKSKEPLQTDALEALAPIAEQADEAMAADDNKSKGMC